MQQKEITYRRLKRNSANAKILSRKFENLIQLVVWIMLEA